MEKMKLEMSEDGRTYKLLEAYKINDDLTIPAGFETDFASVPKIFWNILPPTGEYSRAALAHDWYYRNPDKRGGKSRKDVDELFLKLMKEDRVSYTKRYAMYWAVRMGGSSSWR